MSDSTHTQQPGPDAGAIARRDGPGAVQTLEASRQTTVSLALAGLVPGTIGEAMTLATALSKSRAIPFSYRSAPDTVLTAILAGIEIGLTPIRALNSFVVISGNLSMKADLVLAVVRKSGLLEFYAEGFERWQKTDADLEKRLAARAVTGGAGMAVDAAQVWAAGVAAEIRAAAGYAMDLSREYGWCIMRRRGEGDTVRTFSWADADRIQVPRKEKGKGQRPGGGVEVEDEDDEAPPADGAAVGRYMPLHQKHNYRHFPQDMYPRRARVRAANQGFSDVIAGIPATESLEHGQVIEGELVRSTATSGEVIEASDQLIDEMVGNDPEVAGRIVAGFEQLEMNEAQKLQRLREFKNDPPKLLEWLKGEFVQRSSGGQRHVAKPEPPDRESSRSSRKKPQPKIRGKVTKSPPPAPVQPATSETKHEPKQEPAPSPEPPKPDLPTDPAKRATGFTGSF